MRFTTAIGMLVLAASAAIAEPGSQYTQQGEITLKHGGKAYRGTATFTIERKRTRSAKRPVAKPAAPRAGMQEISCGGKPIKVAPTMATRFAGLCAELVGRGYKIEFVGGWRPGTCSFASRHPCGGAIDINQTARNVVTQRLPADINAIARRHGLLHGGEWRHADAGHFERLDRHSLAQIEAPAAKGPPLVAWSERPAIEKPERAVSTSEAILEALDDARTFLIRTATIGGTMARQGPDVALGRLHPVMAVRMASALGEARQQPGLERAGCFSAYRAPGLGVGGYRNKFDSNHAYGLACDMFGIGRPGSREAKLWHKIATAHGLYNPYFGTRMTWEWNHYQVTPTLTAARSLPALRRTITRNGPPDEPRMWRVADALIDRQLGPPLRMKRKRTRVAGL